MTFSRFIRKGFFLDPWWEMKLQVSAVRLMAEDPFVYSLGDLLGTSTSSSTPGCDFVTIWNRACPASPLVTQVEFRPHGELDSVVVEDHGTLVFDESLADYPIAQLLTQAHVASIYFIRDQYGRRFNVETQTLYANVLLVVRGFGAVLVESLPTDNFTKPALLPWRDWWMARRGHLEVSKIGYLLALVARRQGVESPDWVMHLNSTMRNKFLRSSGHFENQAPSLFDQRFDPENEYSPEIISNMIRGNAPEQFGAMSWLISHRQRNLEWCDTVSNLLTSRDSDVVAMAIQAFAATAIDQTAAIDRIRQFLCHRSNVVVGCAFQSLKYLGDDTEFLERVRMDLEKRNVPFDRDV